MKVKPTRLKITLQQAAGIALTIAVQDMKIFVKEERKRGESFLTDLHVVLSLPGTTMLIH